jgi:small conductance mechanosensitive channel
MLESLLEQLDPIFSKIQTHQFLLSIVHICEILLIGLIVLKLVDAGLKGIWARVSSHDILGRTRVEQRTETLRHIVRSVGRIVIWGAAIMMIIHEFGVDTGPLLTGAGILGLAVGFGAQALVKDVITGFFILLEDQYGVGDSVRIGDLEGVVEDMSLRTTILRNFEGHIHVIPNGAVSSVTVTTRDWARAVVDITVPHNVEIARLFNVLEGSESLIAEKMKDQVLDKPRILGIEKFSDEGATVRMAVKTLPLKRAEVTREWRRLIREVLDKEGIELSQKKEI